MRAESALGRREFMAQLRASLDEWFLFGQEKYVGWVLGRVFCVRYFSGRGFGRRYYPIHNAAMGFVHEKDGRAQVCFVSFCGATDPPTLLLMYAFALAILRIAQVPGAWRFALGIVASVAAFTFLCTVFSEDGYEGRRKLVQFIGSGGDRYTDLKRLYRTRK